jgi:translation elongation factor EF-G
VIPGVFMAAVEKGVRQALADGVVAGFPVQDLRVTVYDGKSHPVDGKDIAFFMAARKATVEAIRAARPIILEPVVDIEILAPDAVTGDVTGDLSSKRGHLTGTQPRGAGRHGDYRQGAAGRTRELPVAPQVADRRPGLVQYRFLALRPGTAGNTTATGGTTQGRRRGISEEIRDGPASVVG